jgi:hypothetical protein
MIRYSSNTFRHRIALLCDGAKIRPEPCSNRGNQPRFAIFCAENIMDPNRAKGAGHREAYRMVEKEIALKGRQIKSNVTDRAAGAYPGIRRHALGCPLPL